MEEKAFPAEESLRSWEDLEVMGKVNVHPSESRWRNSQKVD